MSHPGAIQCLLLSLVLLLPQRFWVIGLSIPTVSTWCLKDLVMGNDTIYPYWGGLLELVAKVLVAQKKGKLSVKSNNYLLKDKGITIIYKIYLLWEIVAFVVFVDRQLSYLAGAVFLTEFLGELDFCWRVFSPWDISFLIFLSLVWISDLFSHLTLKNIEDSPLNKHSRLTYQSHTFTTFLCSICSFKYRLVHFIPS